MKDDDFIMIPSEEIKGVMAMMAAKQKVRRRAEIILNSDTAGYRRMEDYLNIMGVDGTIKKMILKQMADAGLAQAVATEDLLLRLNMIDNGDSDSLDYVDLDDVGDAENPNPEGSK